MGRLSAAHLLGGQYLFHCPGWDEPVHSAAAVCAGCRRPRAFDLCRGVALVRREDRTLGRFSSVDFLPVRAGGGGLPHRHAVQFLYRCRIACLRFCRWRSNTLVAPGGWVCTTGVGFTDKGTPGSVIARPRAHPLAWCPA